MPFLSTAQTPTWVNKIGGTLDDAASKSAIDGSGNLYITGFFQGMNVDFDPSSAAVLLNSSGGKDAFVAKYDALGNLVWAFKIGGTNQDEANDIVLDNTGSLLITGYFRGQGVDFDPSGGTASLNSHGEEGGDPGFGGDIFVAKYDVSGNFKWAHNIGGTSLGDNGTGIGVDNLGNILLTGYLRSEADFDPSPNTSIFDGSTAPIFIAKFTSEGFFQWIVNAGQPNADNTGYDITSDQQNNVLVTGYFQGTNIDFDPSPAANLLSSKGGFDFFVAKYSPNGQYLWAQSAGGAGTDVGRSVTTDVSNNIYIAGDYSSGSINFNNSVANDNIINNGANDFFLVKFAETGKHLWSLGIGGSGVELGWDLSEDYLGNIIVGGVLGSANVDFNPSAGVALLSTNGNYDGMVVRFTNAGEYICAFNFGGAGNDAVYAVNSIGNDFFLFGKFISAAVDFDPGPRVVPATTNGEDAFIAKFNWAIAKPPAGNITGSTICTGQPAQMTFTASAGTPPFTLTFSDGTNSYVQTEVVSGVSFNLAYSPLQTTTYTLVSIKDAAGCSSPVLASGTATVTIYCGAEDCSNNIDDDGDGLIDCADSDCMSCTGGCGPAASLNAKIFNTGNNGAGSLLPLEAIDRHWTVSNTLTGPKRNAIYTGNCALGYWTPTPFSDAGWITDKAIGVCGTVNPQNDSSKRFFSTQFNVPASIVSSLSLSFDVYADNFVGEVYVNGVAQGIRKIGADLYCRGCNISFTLQNGFVPGTNTITILILQDPIPEFPAGNQKLGLLVSASASLDSDGDGVSDGFDKCAGTPPGATVDAAGCFKVSINTNAPVCAGDSIVLKSAAAGIGSVYQWTTPNGNTISGKRIVVQNANDSHTGIYRLTITDSYGCVWADSVDVQLNAKPIATINAATAICQGENLRLQSSGGVFYKWTPESGLDDAAASNPLATPQVTTTYVVSVANAAGCTDTAATTITVIPKPNLHLGNDTAVCSGQSILLNGVLPNATTYLWNTGSTENSITATAAGMYTVSVKVAGCNALITDSINILLQPLPTVFLGKDTTVCSVGTMQLKAAGKNIDRYVWSNGSTDSVISVNAEGRYRATAFNECGFSTDDILVTIKSCTDDLHFPTAFTPNGDGLNDVFRAAYIGDFPVFDYSLKIFNRWGEVVFATSDVAAGWNGKFKGAPQATHTFIWIAGYKKTPTGKAVFKKGTATLVR